MKNWLDVNRGCAVKALLFALAFLTWSAAPLYAQSDSIRGLVVNADGTLIAGVAVRAKLEGTNPASLPAIVTQTDSSGHYLLEAVPAGTYLVTAGPEDGTAVSFRASLVMSSTIFDDVFFITTTGKPDSVVIRAMTTPILTGLARVTIPSTAATALNIVMAPSAVSVSGRLEFRSGMTLPQMTVNLTETTSRLTADVEVHPDGSFVFPQIPPGSYGLRLNPNLGIPASSITVADQNLSGIVLGGKSAGVRVSGSTIRSDLPQYQDKFPEWVYLVSRDAVDVQTNRIAGLTGIIIGLDSALPRPQPVPQISAFDAGGASIEAPIAPVGPDGQFEFLAIPPGTYTIRTVPEVGLASTSIAVTSDKDIDGIRVGNGVRVRGDVIATNAGTRPPELINLTASGAKGQSVSTLVNANGSFEFPKIGAGTYRILLDGKVRPTPTEITVVDDDVIIRVETPFSAWVPGRVVFDGPSPTTDGLEGTKVALSNGYDAAIKPDGSFQIKSIEGEFEFFVINLPEGYLLKSVTSGGANLMTESVKVDLRIPPSEILVTLQYKPVAPQ